MRKFIKRITAAVLISLPFIFISEAIAEKPLKIAVLALNAIRTKFPDVTIVAGGEHITALTEYSMRDCSGLDVCIRGEGEIKFLDLLEGLSQQKSLSEINGICFTQYIDFFFRNLTGYPNCQTGTGKWVAPNKLFWQTQFPP